MVEYMIDITDIIALYVLGYFVNFFITAVTYIHTLYHEMYDIISNNYKINISKLPIISCSISPQIIVLLFADINYKLQSLLYCQKHKRVLDVITGRFQNKCYNIEV